MPITDLQTLSTGFSHPVHLEAYLAAFYEAFVSGKFDAIPGKEIKLTCGKKAGQHALICRSRRRALRPLAPRGR